MPLNAVWRLLGGLSVLLLIFTTNAFAGQVGLAWNASTGASGYRVYYGISSGNYTANMNAGNTTTATVPNLTDGGMYYFAVKAYSSSSESGYSNEVTGTARTPTSTGPLQGGDIGNPGLAGSTSYANGTYTLRGSGWDIEGGWDAFHFAYQSLDGNRTIVARVDSMTNTNSWAKAGVMIRETLNPDSKHAMVVVTPNNGVAFQRRTSAGGTTAHRAGAAVKAPYWVKLKRSGNYFTAYQSTDGVTWAQIGSRVTISMGSTVFVGLAVTSHDDTKLSTATFKNVSIQ
jgi:hypothetical protein